MVLKTQACSETVCFLGLKKGDYRVWRQDLSSSRMPTKKPETKLHLVPGTAPWEARLPSVLPGRLHSGAAEPGQAPPSGFRVLRDSSPHPARPRPRSARLGSAPFAPSPPRSVAPQTRPLPSNMAATPAQPPAQPNLLGARGTASLRPLAPRPPLASSIGQHRPPLDSEGSASGPFKLLREDI